MGGTTPLITDQKFKDLFETHGAAGGAQVTGGMENPQLTPPSARRSPAPPTEAPKKPLITDEDFDKTFGKNATPLNEGISGEKTGIDPSQYDFQTKLGQDNDLLRAQRQGVIPNALRTVGNTLANIPLDMVQAIGYTGELLDSSHDYDNALISGPEKFKNPFGEVYRKHPDQVFDLADPSWWMNNIGGFVEGAAQFIVPGEAEAAGIGALTKAVSTGLKLTKGATEAMMGAGHVLSSSHLAYLMAASSGRQVYQQSYDTNYHRLLQQGLDPYTADDQAKQISAKAAATTVQTSTMLNTVFGLAGMAPMFKTNENKILSWLGDQGARQEGESLEGWKQRLSSVASDPDFQAALKTRSMLSMQGYPAQAMQIGLQGISNEYAEKVGKEVAEGKSRDNVDAISDFFDKVTDQEGALNFLIGAVGGPAHALLMDHVPIHQVIRYDENGQPLYKKDPTGKLIEGTDGKPQYLQDRVSARTRDELGNQVFFANMRDAINKDVDWYSGKRQEMAAAIAKNDHLRAEMLRQEMFSVNNLNAVSMGLGDNWKQEYQDIAALDNHKDLGQQLQPQIDSLTEQIEQTKAQGQDTAPAEQQLATLQKQQQTLAGKTEAMTKGFSRGVEDNDYKTRAQRAISNLEWMKTTYDNVRSKYFSQNDPESDQLSYHVFAREAELHLMKQTIDDERTSIAKDQQILDPLQTYYEQMKVAEQVRTRLQDDSDQLRHAANNNDLPQLRKLMGKYGVPAYGDHMIHKGIEELVDKLEQERDQHNESIQAATSTLHQESGFNDWSTKNNGKGFEDYLDHISKTQPIDDRIVERKANLEAMESEMNIKQKHLQEIKSSRGIMEFKKNAKAGMDKWKKETEVKNMQDNVNAFLKQQDMAAAERIKRQQLEGEQGELHQRMLHSIDAENRANQRIAELREKLVSLASRRGLRGIGKEERILAVRAEIRRLEAEVAGHQKTRSADNERVQQLSENITNTAQQEDNVKSLTREQVQNNTTSDPTTVDEENTGVPPPGGTTDTEPLPPPVTSDSEQAEQDKPVEDYGSLKNGIDPIIRQTIETLEDMQPAGNYSIDLAKSVLQPWVDNGTISEDTAHDIITKQRSFLDQQDLIQFNASMDAGWDPNAPLIRYGVPDRVQRALDEKQLELAGKLSELADRLDSMPPDPTENITAPEEPFSPVVNMNPTAVATPEEAMQIDQHVGAKVMDSMKINTAAIQYMEVVKHGKMGSYQVFLPLYDKLDPAFNKNILKPNFMQTGDDIEFVVDTAWRGRINYDKSLEQDDYGDPLKRKDSFDSYTNQNGKIRMEEGGGYTHENFPVKIVHTKSGETVGYLPRVDWVTAQYAGSGYRNMVDEITDPDTGETTTGNVEAQRQKLITVRKIIALAYNEGNGQTIKSTLNNRESGGHPFYSTEVNKNTETSKLKPKLAKNLLPDKSLQFGILNKGTVYVGHNTPLEGGKNFTDRDMLRYGKPGQEANNVPMVILPMPNGKSNVSPLYTRSLADRPADIHTIARAIEAHLAAGTPHDNDQYRKVRDKIGEATAAGGRTKPLDITNPRDLETFINQYYTYTQHFNRADTAFDAKLAPGVTKKQPRFMLDIAKEGLGTNRPEIKIGTSWSGQSAALAEIDPATGKLRTSFEDALTEGLKTHYKNVVYTRGDLRGVNDERPMHAITIQRDGKIRIDKHDNYNDYLKSFADTIVYGHHQAEDGTYLYGANPVTNFDFNQIAATRLGQTGAIEEGAKPGELTHDEDNIFSSMINGAPAVPGEQAPEHGDPEPPLTTQWDMSHIAADSPAGIQENLGKLYDEASANPEQTYHLELSGNPKGKIKFSDKTSMTMTQLAAMVDSRPIPYNLKFSDDFMSILQNTPRRFLNNLMFEDSAMYQPLPYDEKILGQQIKEMFVPVRDAEGNDTGVFDAERQTEVVDNVVQAIKWFMDNGKGKGLSVEGYKDSVKNNVFKMMRDKYQQISEGKPMKGMENVTADQATNLVREYDKVLRSFDTKGLNFWSLAIDKLKALGINVRDNSRGADTAVLNMHADGTDPLSSSFEEDAGHGMQDWSDVSFETDPKDTATGRMKMFFATIPDSKVGDEELPREIKLSFTDPKIREKIVKGQKLLTTRTPDQVQQMGLKLGQDVVTKIDGKLMRVTPLSTLNDSDAIAHEGIGREEETIPKPGDMLLRMQPYEPKKNVLTNNKNYLGLSKLADYEQLFESVLGKLAGTPKNFDSYLSILREEGNQFNPNLRALAERLDKAPTEIKNEFVSVVSLQYQPFSMVLLDNRNDASGDSYYVLRTIEANRGSQINTIIDGWQQNQKFSEILRKNDSGITVIDRQKADTLKQDLAMVNNLYTKGDPTAQQKAVELLQKVMSMNGITMPDEAIRSFVQNTLKWTKKTSVSGDFRRQFGVSDKGEPLGIVSSMILKLSGTEASNDNMDEMEDKSFMLTNPLYTEKSSVSILARVAAAHSTQLYSNTHRSSEGKNIYDYGFNNSLSRQVQNIKDPTFRSRYTDVDIAKNSWLLGHIDADAQLRERFSIAYLDGLKVAYMPNASGVIRPAMSDREQLLTSIGMFINQGDAKYAHYISLTHSDKTTTPVFRNAPRLREVTTAKFVEDKITGGQRAIMSLSEEALNKMHDTFNSEYDRIQRAAQVIEQNGGYNNPKYEEGSKYFYFLPQLNYEAMKTAAGEGKIPQKVFEKIWVAGNEKLNVKEAPGFREAVQWMLTRHVDDMTNNTLHEWKKNGIIQEDSTPFDRKYLNRLLSSVGIYSQKQTDGTFKYVDRNGQSVDSRMIPQLTAQMSARDYAVNHYLMNVSMSQLFYGDPAQVWKGSVDKTMVEYGKRLAKDIAPGRELAFKPGETFTTITAKDFKTNAPYLKEIEGLAKSYVTGRPLESTDAQELTTVQEHINVMHAAGRITDTTYTEMSQIIRDAKGGYYAFTDPHHLDVVMNPAKPVYVGDRPPLNGAILNDYVKSSSYPLYPPFLAGKELDKVRKGMEDGGIARLNFESAHKIGVPTTPVDLFDAQGRVREEVFSSPEWTGRATTDQRNANAGPVASARQEMNRDNFRIQQEVPYDEDKDSIRTVSQMNKLITQGIQLIKTPFRFGGRDISAKDLIAQKEIIRQKLFQINRDKLAERIGAHFAENGKMYVTNKTKLFDDLQKQALEGNLGFTANDLAYLKEANRLPNSDELVIPLFFAPSAPKFEAMLMSMVGDIGNIKMPGKSYVQASPVGQQSVKEWESLPAEQKKNIVHVGDYKGEALKTVRIEDGKVRPAQIIAPFNFQIKGKPVKLENYLTTGEDGRKTLDMDKVPAELLQLVGARIPNQGHNSMLPIEIVGFTPNNMGDLVIVPAAITKQMGADFDVDKLYTYKRGYGYTDGKFHIASPDETESGGEDYLKNEYFDTHWSVLTHPEMVKNILNPLDKNDLKDEAALIEKWEAKLSTFKPTYYDPMYQLRDFQAQKDAKRLVGLSSLSTTFNAVIQDKNIRPGVLDMGPDFQVVEKVIPISLIDERGEQRHLSTLSGYGQSLYHSGDGNGEIRSKHDNHTTVQSEVLDYAKNKVSDKVHLSTFTYPASAALTQLQTPDHTDGDETGKLLGESRGWAAHLGYNARLLSQPIIQEWVAEMAKRGDSLSGDYTPDLKNEVARTIMQQYLDQAHKEAPADDYTVSYKDLTDSLKAPTSVKDFNGKQVKMLELFLQLDQIGSTMMKAQSTINHDTRGAGATLLDTLSKETTRARVENSEGKDGEIQLLGTRSLYANDNGHTEQGSLYNMVHDTARSVVGGLFPYQQMMPIFDYIMEHTSRQDLSIDMQKGVFNSVKSYIFTHPKLGFWDDPQVTRANLLYRRGDNPSLADRVHEAKNTFGQNNYFLQRLQVSVDPDNIRPSHISYQASKASMLDDYENTKSMLDLFLSTDPTHRKLAEDLVRYSYLTGGLQDARSFVKYIPYSYLVGTDFGHMLRELSEPSNLSSLIVDQPGGFREQWFQHNPQVAKSLSPDMRELGSKQDKYPERFTLPDINREGFHDGNPAKGLIVRIKTDKARIDSYPDYLSYRSKDENRWILYKSTPSIFGNDFVRIDTLGDKDMDEYSVGDGLVRRSLIPENRSRAYDNIEPAPRMLSGAPFIESGHTVMEDMGIPRKGDYNDMLNVLRGLSNDKGIPQHARVVSDFLAKLDDQGVAGDALSAIMERDNHLAPSFRFIRDSSVETSNMAEMDIWNNRITLMDSKIGSKADIAEAINHEMLHAHTSTLTMLSENEGYLRKRGFNDQQIKWISDRWESIRQEHPEIERAVKELEQVRKQAEDKLRQYAQDKGMNYDELYDKVINKKQISTDMDRLIYSMASNTEFVTGSLTHHGTMRWLNQQQYEGNLKGMLSRVSEIVKNMMMAVGRAFGYTATRGSLLEAAMEKSLEMATIGKHSYDLTPEVLHTPNNMDFTLAAPVTTPTIAGLDKVIGKLEEQKDEIVNSLTGRLPKEEVADKQAKIDDIESDIKKLQDNLSTELVAEIGKKHLGWVDKVIKAENPSNSQIMTASRVLEVWTNLVDMLYGESNPSPDGVPVESKVPPEMSDIYANAQVMRNLLTGRMKNTLINTSDNVVGMKDFNTGNLVDISRAEALTRGLSSAATSRATQYIAAYMETVARHRDEDITRLVYKMRGLEDKMSVLAGGKKNLPEFYDKFFQQSEDGEAWGLVQRFHQDWYNFRRSLYKARNEALDSINNNTLTMGADGPMATESQKAADRKRVWQNYWKHMNESAVFADTRHLFDEAGELKTDEKAQAHRAELEKELGKETADELINGAHEQYKKYLDVKEARFADIDGEVAAGEMPQQEADRHKDEFTAKYSPNVFFNNFSNPKANFSTMNSDQYVRSAPKRSVREGGFYDKKFEEIQKDPKVKAVYDEINSTMQSLKDSLPVHVQQKLGKNFMAAIPKSLFTDIIDVPGYVKTMGRRMIDDLTASTSEEMTSDKAYSKLPLRYIHDDRENLPLESRSRDIPRILEVFGMMALHYKHFADAKDYIDMGETILSEMDKARSSGASQMYQNGRLVTVKDGLRNTMDALKYMKDYLMYKKTRALEGKTETMLYSPNPITQFKTAHTVKDLIVEREKVQQGMINGDMDPAEALEKMQEINAKLAAFEGRRLYGSKFGDKLISINQLKTLSYNPFSGIANVAFGVVSAAIHANGRTDFNWKELGQAYKMMGGSMLKWFSFGTKESATASKLLAIMDRLGIIGDVIDSHYGKVKTREREPGWQKAVNPFNWMRSGDYYMKGLTTVAMMLHDKVDVTEAGEAKKVSVWEALDENGQWDSKRFGENKSWHSEDLNEQKDFDKFRNKATRVNMIIHGNQDKNSPKLANKYIIGRLIGQFRMSWLPEGWYSRFQGSRYDVQLGREIKGRYATVKELGFLGTAHVLLKQMASIVSKVDPYTGVSRLDGKPLSTVDVENMRRNFAELGFIAAMAGTIITLKSAIDPDGDDKVKWSLQMLANQLIRNQQDLEFYASPSVFDSITRNVIPATDVLKDYWKAMKATARVLSDSDYEADKWLFAVTHAGIPIPQTTMINKVRTMATRDLNSLQQ